MNPHTFELRNLQTPRRPYKVAIFDFDGTLSLFREGWPKIMIDMMVAGLKEQNLLREPETEAWRYVEDFVMTLNGKPSIFQMQRYTEEIRTRGGRAEDPLIYLDEYHRQLLAVVRRRHEEVLSHEANPAEWAVPGVHALLEHLTRHGVKLYLASGTVVTYVREEANLLDVARFFGPHFYAPADDSGTFSKRGVIEKLLVDEGIDGSDLLGFGDGVTETQEVKRVGGTAIAVASVERGLDGVHADKRERLLAAGADAVIADFRDEADWLPWLMNR